MRVRKAAYSCGSGAPGRSRWKSSICACSASRRASSSRLRGVSSSMIASAPAQNASASTPDPGSASSVMNAWSDSATLRLPTRTRPDILQPPDSH